MSGATVMASVEAAVVRVMVVDAHPLVRHGLRRLAETSGEFVVVAEASTAAQATAMLEHVECEVLVLDVALPDRDGFDVLRDLVEHREGLPVLVLSAHPEEHLGVRALRAGAKSYLSKGAAPEEVLLAIRRVSSGSRYMSESLSEKLIQAWQRPADRPPHEDLSGREYQVLCLIAGGKTVREIAALLAISINTVGTYRKRVFAKMRVRSTAELTRYALSHRLVE